MIMDELERFKGQSVEIIYNGVTYRGRLAGASEDEIYLQTSTEWLSLPMEGITHLQAPGSESGL